MKSRSDVCLNYRKDCLCFLEEMHNHMFFVVHIFAFSKRSMPNLFFQFIGIIGIDSPSVLMENISATALAISWTFTGFMRNL